MAILDDRKTGTRAMRPAVEALLLVATLAGLALAQDQPRTPLPPPAAGLQRVRDAFFQIDLPEQWRRLTPNEGVSLGHRLPWDLRVVQPNHLLVYGDVDRWIADGFDGRALRIVMNTLELGIDRTNLEAIEAHWREWRSPEGDRRDVVSSAVGTVGLHHHPALCLELRTLPGEGHRALRSLDFYTSTSGQQLILSFSAWENDWQVAEPEIRRLAGSLIFPRPPKRPEELGGRLLQAAILGGLVAFLLIAIRHIRSITRTPT